MRLDNMQIRKKNGKPTKKALDFIKEVMQGFQVSRITAIRALLIIDRRRFNNYKTFYRILKKLDKLLNGFGIEYIATKDDTYHEYLGLEYINTGDTYGLTIIWDSDKSRLDLTTWGNIVESRMSFYI